VTEQQTFFNRIGRFFKRPGHASDTDLNVDTNGQTVTVTTKPIVRRWGRNTAAIEQLQGGFDSLTQLMNAIRESMDAQGRRQDELLGHLSTLPRLMEAIPEANRLQGQTLKAIHEQLVHHASQQRTLGEILEKLSESGGDQKDILEGLRERIETINHQDQAMAESLGSVSTSLFSIGRSSAASAEVMENLRDTLHNRDSSMEAAMQKQTSKMTTLLIVAIVLSSAALAAVVVVAFLILHGVK